QGHRPPEVDQLPELRVLEELVGLAQVALDGHGVVAGQQGPAVGHTHRVDVDVDHPGLGSGRLGDLVDVALGGQAAAEVDELPDPGVGEGLDGPAQELPVVLDHVAGDRGDGQYLVGDLAVGREVVLAAEEVVVDARRVRHAGVDPGGPVVGHLCSVRGASGGS